ncbi:MAG: hypothetical protein COV01_03620 [Candidatus Taylorbacteria bacterium CG10_big_fil_rev_8_21_14_0_10_41_48]|uniref:Uncharacterized protein n=1 Tax=Candidatus Taylorbacteria bacterium CG10_big_fil_rev_8_21_14_0_10_41_48 TaxID=1975024 RepID=A0A2M8LBC9_9BACT|nr:MAG: hypothetical protein COV01_03620 [Candidatus Taylorbacteria bacterium CG10_big_fil_rev_8_21_14_0_10_41_48]
MAKVFIDNDPVTRAVEEIERVSQCSERSGREKGQVLIDMAILSGFADPDEIEHEEEVCRHSDHVFKHEENVSVREVGAFFGDDSPEAHDFRNGIELHDPKHPTHRLRLKSHPECEDGEIYLISITPKGFDAINWETKRLGKKSRCGCYPVFVRRTELLEAGYRLVSPRKRKSRKIA